MYIYKITNKINGKIYIGQTIYTVAHRFSTHKAEAKLNRSNTIFTQAIRKYGIENFIVETLMECQSIEELNNKEIELIKYYKSLIPNGYNIDEGGKNRKLTEETKRKLSIKNSKAVIRIDSITKEEKFYKSILEAKKEGFCSDTIIRQCKGRKCRPSKFYWKYADEDFKGIIEENKPKSSKCIIRINPITNEYKEYESLHKAANEGFIRHCITHCCKNSTKQHKNYLWKYKEAQNDSNINN